MIPIRLIGPNATVRILGLLDTGADHVFVSASVAKVLGIEVGGEAETAVGAGSHALDVWPRSVEIEIAQKGESYRWPVEVGFLSGDDDPPIVYLGHAGFLEYLRATFDGDAQTVELIPSQRLASIG